VAIEAEVEALPPLARVDRSAVAPQSAVIQVA
jgi:hypothetical protein